MIKYINKDITTVNKGIVAHGVNCQGVMGSGVAAAIRKKWPEVFDKYKQLIETKRTEGRDSSVLLGHFQVIKVGEELIVANCFTQIFYGRGETHAVPKAIEQSLSGIFNFAFLADLDLYIPKIGAGLGGLNWENDVEPIIENISKEHQSKDIYVCVFGVDR